MTRKLTMLFAVTAIVAGLATATAVFSEENTPSSSPPPTTHGAGMMGGHDGMMSMMGRMSADQMKQMVDNCNRMMESMTTTPTAPDEKATPSPKG